MTYNKIASHQDLVDGLVRRFFAVEPDVMASLPNDDEQTALQRPPSQLQSTDPLDGLDVLARRIVAACLTIRRHPGKPVALVTERQAASAGWPSARLANLTILLAWALYVEREGWMVMPLLLEADERSGCSASRLIQIDPRLPNFETLMTAFRKGWYPDDRAVEQHARACQDAPLLKDRRLASPYALLRNWLDIDAYAVELPSDRCGPKAGSGDYRAIWVLGWVTTRALDLSRVMEEEWITAVRLKTAADSELAEEPSSATSNLALLLAAAIHHGGGCTPHFLAAREDLAQAVVEAGRLLESRPAGGGDADEMSFFFEIWDRAQAGFVHVGRRAAKGVATRIFDRCIASAHRSAAAVDGAAP